MNCKVNVIIQLLSVSFWKLRLHVYQVPHLYVVFFCLPLYSGTCIKRTPSGNAVVSA